MHALPLENDFLRLEVSSHAEPMIEGTSQAWRTLMSMVEKIAPSQAPVLIQGEAGTGKELIARRVHHCNKRNGPFLAINCGAIQSDLLESELFGHEKDASPGATMAKTGLIAAAGGGTIFLDEIGEMSGAMQMSLLRVLERGEYRPVGGTRILHANVRFVAATNRDLQELVLAGKFRDDLFYRINTIALKVPPLRERAEDIPRLADYFLKTLRQPGTPIRTFSKDALEQISMYAWPGNVRELRNVVERLFFLSPANTKGPIDSDELATVLQPTSRDVKQSAPLGSLEEAEKVQIRKVLHEQKGNKTRTARTLGIDYKTLLTKLRKYGVMT